MSNLYQIVVKQTANVLIMKLAEYRFTEIND